MTQKPDRCARKSMTIQYSLPSVKKAAKITNDVNKKVYKGLKKDEIKVLDRIIQARRVIAIDKYKPAAPGQDPLFATMKHYNIFHFDL